LEQNDLMEAKRRAIATMKLQYENLETKQQRELDCMMVHANRALEVCEKNRKTCVKSVERVVERLGDFVSQHNKRGRKVSEPSPKGSHIPLEMPSLQTFETTAGKARRPIRIIRGSAVP
jgi:hypothetical protein